MREGVDYVQGAPFFTGAPVKGVAPVLFTARILGDPLLWTPHAVTITIAVINNIGFYTKAGAQRWSYFAMDQSIWNKLDVAAMTAIVGGMYRIEGGTAMKHLFPSVVVF